MGCSLSLAAPKDGPTLLVEDLAFHQLINQRPVSECRVQGEERLGPKRARAEFAVKSADSRIAEGSLDGVKLAIVRPQTFMNDSGRAVRKLLDRYRADPAALFVVYDDVDLPLGKIRIRERGGPGTHNGMRSIVGVVGEGFPRLRVGVAPADPTAEIGELVEHVLAPFTADEREAAEAAIARATEAVEVALRDGITRAMEQFNG